mmetsp:Transcript_46305/g.76976  ORF Transcript_46305/g.76976 Transcript_46305/m.76976 type:complete len:450 (-) Transcript_46305:225-1574(-)
MASVSIDTDVLIYATLEILLVLLLTLICIHAVFKICYGQPANDNAELSLIRKIQSSTMGSILSYTIAVVAVSTWDILSIFYARPMIIFGDIAIAFDCFARILFQITFIFRLQTCFYGTSMQFSQRALVTLYICTATLCLPGIGLCIDMLRWYASILWLILDFFLSVAMSYLFLSRLHLVICRSALNTLSSPAINASRANSMIDYPKDSPSNRPVIVPPVILESSLAAKPSLAESGGSMQNTTEVNNQRQRPQPQLQVEEHVREDEIVMEDMDPQVEDEEEEEKKHGGQLVEHEVPAMSDAVLSVPGSYASQTVSPSSGGGGRGPHSRHMMQQQRALISKDFLHEYDLVRLITKYSLLVSIAYCSSLVSVIVIYALREDVERHIYRHAQYVEHLLIIVNIVVNVLCLYLSYGFNDVYYNSLCACGHRVFKLCCVHFIEKKLKEDMGISTF